MSRKIKGAATAKPSTDNEGQSNGTNCLICDTPLVIPNGNLVDEAQFDKLVAKSGIRIFEGDPNTLFRRPAKPEQIEAARKKISKLIESNRPTPDEILELLARAWARAEELTEEVTDLTGKLGGYKVYLMKLAGTLGFEDKQSEIFFNAAMSCAANHDETVRLMFEAEIYSRAAARKETAEKGAATKLARDPKQAAKLEARKLWESWRARPSLHKSAAAFARFVVDSIPAIEAEETVKRWEREWRKEAKGK